MIIKDWKKEILTVPNSLSMVRLLMIPIYVLIYLKASTPAHYCIAAILLAASCLTDMIDGKIARRFDMVSTVGKVLDPIADKATQFTLILCLATRHKSLWLILPLFILKESFQFIAGLVTLKRGMMLTGALISGKICTAVLFSSLILLVLLPELPRKIVTLIASVDGVFMSISFIDYVRTYCQRPSMLQSLKHDDQSDSWKRN